MRDKLRLSAANIAEKLGVSREAITQIETGRNNITAVSIWKLATLFNCDLADFFPKVPEGYGLSRVDLHAISQEGGDKAVKWAETLFKEKKK
jgi:transcriptional regulator with XRE-family HTH domain